MLYGVSIVVAAVGEQPHYLVGSALEVALLALIVIEARRPSRTTTSLATRAP